MRRRQRRTSSFNPMRCAIPVVWCGRGAVPATQTASRVYTGRGTTVQCLRQGIGAGIASEKAKTTPEHSLKNIRYVGDTYEARFDRLYGIRTLHDLRTRARQLDTRVFARLLRKVCTRSDRHFDPRAYNSVLLWLYENGVQNLPRCTKLT